MTSQTFFLFGMQILSIGTDVFVVTNLVGNSCSLSKYLSSVRASYGQIQAETSQSCPQTVLRIPMHRVRWRNFGHHLHFFYFDI